MSTGSVNGWGVGVAGSVGVNTARVGIGGVSVAGGGAVRVQADKRIATTNKRSLIRLMSSSFVEAGKLLRI